MNTLTVITPTIGKPSLHNLIQSIKEQNKLDIQIQHIILWDAKIDKSFTKNPYNLTKEKQDNYYVDVIKFDKSHVQGQAFGSSLRAVGLMGALSEWVTFADDDIMWEENHLESVAERIEDKQWGYVKRRIWTLNDDNYEYIGVDDFESVGEKAKTPYKMVDNNCMFFKRRLGTSASVLYRETKEYNDDRLMYQFLKEYGGEPFETNIPTVNQVCPEKLIDFFKQNCTRENNS
jgi:hypothetical protein